jgi:conjugal transfer mating pair stabilization protein TraG
VKRQQIGRTEEDLKQTLPIWDSSEKRGGFQEKLETLRAQQNKAS